MSDYPCIKTLIIEDDPMVQRINEQYLDQQEGFTCVGLAKALNEAKVIIQNTQPHLILLDVYLLNDRGIDLVIWLRQQTHDVDVIMITADHSIQTIKTARQYGVMDYLIKPFTYERFQEALNTYKQYYRMKLGKDTVNQDQVNSLFNHSPMPIRKSDLNPTDTQILCYLKNHPSVGKPATDVAEAMGISRITARRHLDHLHALNYLNLDQQFGGVGRPQNLYSFKEGTKI